MPVIDLLAYAGYRGNLEGPRGDVGKWAWLSGIVLNLANVNDPLTQFTSPAGSDGAATYTWTGNTGTFTTTVTVRPTNRREVTFVWVVASDEDVDVYPSMVYPGDWMPRLSIAADIMQESLARMLDQAGYGRRSFNLDRRSSAARAVRVAVMRIPVTGADLRSRESDTSEDYDGSTDDDRIFSEMFFEAAYRFPTPSGSRTTNGGYTIPMMVLAATRTNMAGATMDAKIRGQVQQSYTDGIASCVHSMGLAGVPDVRSGRALFNAFTDQRTPASIPEPSVAFDGQDRRWANTSYWLAMALHELIHGFGSSHTTSTSYSIMQYGVPWYTLSRWFVSPEPAHAARPQAQWFGPQDRANLSGTDDTGKNLLTLLANSPWLTTSFNGTTWFMDPPQTAALTTSPTVLALQNAPAAYFNGATVIRAYMGSTKVWDAAT